MIIMLTLSAHESTIFLTDYVCQLTQFISKFAYTEVDSVRIDEPCMSFFLLEAGCGVVCLKYRPIMILLQRTWSCLAAGVSGAQCSLISLSLMMMAAAVVCSL